ncbi:hypothetical protein [Halosimplex rubrum]|uniref:hypothetical protein n=1 Tax=Halosimplex rubrum TaxID=869889 RepID=UPI001C54E17B|nr:hypothetical protein [Halosimplex rubrum]
MPIAASFVQAAIALAGVNALEIPVIGAMTALLQSVAVFDAAAVVFRNSPEALLALFVLVLVGWLAEGGAVFVLRNRTAGLGTAGFVTLFFALFLLVYSPLFGADVPAVELAGFVLVPVVASGASWAAVLTYEWSETLDEETEETLAAAERRADDARDTFDAAIRKRAGERVRERVDTVVPDAVEALDARAASFRADCDGVTDEVAELRSASGVDSRERNQRADQLLATAGDLDGQAAADDALETFRTALADAVRDRFDDVHVVSRYGEAYEVRNVREYAELDLPSLGLTAQVGGNRHDLADRIAAAIDEGTALSDVARAVERADEHLAALKRTIDEHESAVAEATEAAEERLERVAALTESMDGAAGERLSEFLVEGRFDREGADVPSAVGVRERLRTAREDLHACRFDDARRRAEGARDTAEHLVATAEFFANSVVATIEQRVESVPLPPDVDRELAAAMTVPIGRTHPVSATVDEDTVRLRYEDDSVDDDRGAADGPAHQRSGPSVDQTDANVDDVRYLLRELRDGASTSSADDTVELQTDALPERYVTEPLLSAVESLASRRSDVVEVSIPANAPPGFLTVVVADGESPKSVVAELYDEFLDTQRPD